MNLNKGIFLEITVAVVLVAYVVMAGMNYGLQRDSVRCREVRVVVEDSAQCGFVAPRIVGQWLAEASFDVSSRKLNDIDVGAVENMLAAKDYVGSAKVYTTMEGVVTITLTQRHPLIRIKSETGYEFYVDSSFYILPVCGHFIADVPMVTGQARFSFAEDYYGPLDEKKGGEDIKFLKKLINFVGIIDNDAFLSSLIVQIYVDRQGGVELIPRVGRQVIMVGQLEDCGEKLSNLKEFYTQSFGEMWWKNVKEVDLKYRDQVIVR